MYNPLRLIKRAYDCLSRRKPNEPQLTPEELEHRRLRERIRKAVEGERELLDFASRQRASIPNP